MAIRFYDCLSRGVARAAGFIPARIRSRWIPLLVGGVLLTAASLKAHRLFTDPPSSGGIFEDRWFQVILVEAELACGLALWLGLWPRAVRWAAMLLFAAFFGAALSLALTGAKSCSCLGNLNFSPWLAVLSDLGFLALLVWYTPPASQPAELAMLGSRYAAVLPLGALLAFPVALFGLEPWNAYPRLQLSPATIDLGTVEQAGRRTFALRVDNPHHKPASIRWLKSSCRCLKARGLPWSLSPGSSQTAEFVLDFSAEPQFTGPLLIEFSRADCRPGRLLFRPGPIDGCFAGLTRGRIAMSSANTAGHAPTWAHMSRLRRAWPAGVLLVAAGGAFWLGSHSWQSTQPNGGMVIADEYLDFGEAWEDSRFSWKLPIRNCGSSIVEVTDFVTSCGCASIAPRRFSLAPGESRDVEVGLNLAVLGNGNAGEVRPFQATITPQIRSVAHQHEGWKINGRIRKLLTVSPSGVDFRDGLVVGRPFPSRKVTLTAAVPLCALTAHCDGTKAVLQIGGGPDAFEMTITPAAELLPGPFRIEVELYPERSGVRLPRTKMHFEGLVHRPVEPVPSVILPGVVPIGTTVKETISLVSRTAESFTVEKWTACSSDVLVERVPGASNSFCVSQRITQLRDNRSYLTFSVRMNGSETIQVPLEIVYYGVRPYEGQASVGRDVSDGK